jgi:hypothetical protein
MSNLTNNEAIMVDAMVRSLTDWGDKLRNDGFADNDEAGKALANLCIEIVQLVRTCDLVDRRVSRTA